MQSLWSWVFRDQQPSMPPPEFDQPWREMRWDQKQVLEQKLRKFNISNPDVQQVRILLIGPVGAGKSSFINSVNNVFQGQITSGALVDTTSGKSFTKVFEEESKNMSKNDPKYRTDPGLKDQTFCLVNVLPADKVSLMGQRVRDQMNYARQQASKLNIPQVIIMTRPDTACPLTKKDLRKIYKSKKIKEKMEECSNLVGVPMNHIFPVKNYHEEMDTKDDTDVLILKALDQIVNIANDELKRRKPVL